MDDYTLIWSKTGYNSDGEETIANIFTNNEGDYYIESVVEGDFDEAYAFTFEEAKNMANSLFR